MAFTAEELRQLGLLPNEDEKKPKPTPEVVPSFSEDDLMKLGITVEPQKKPVEDATAVPATSTPETVTTPVEEAISKPEQGTPTLIDTIAPKDESGFRQFTTDQYNELPLDQAMKLYREYMDDPNTYQPPLGIGYAFQTNPKTGEKTYIPKPSPEIFGGGSKVGFTDTAALGLAQGVGNVIELGAAGLDYLGVTEGATEASRNVIPRVKTGENWGDALIAEGAPILAAGAGTGAAIYKGATSIPTLARGVMAYFGGEAAATAVSSTDSGSLLVGENAMLPISRGLDLSDSASNDVLESRFNLLVDGLLSGGVVSGGVTATTTATKLGYNMVVEPFVALARGAPAIENKAVDQIFSVLQQVKPGMDPSEIAKFREEITDIVANNREAILPKLTNLDEDVTISLDTMSALLRGVDLPENSKLAGTAQGLRQGQIQRNAPLTSDAARGPQAALDAETADYLRSVGGETVDDQTVTMLRGADEFAEQGRGEVRTAQDAAVAAETSYKEASDNFLSKIGDDLELTAEIEALGKARGTEITVPRDASRDVVEGQLRTAYDSMASAKNARYAAINGGPIDVGALYDAFSSVKLDELSRQATSLKRTTPLSTIADLLQPRLVDDIPTSGSGTAVAIPGQAAPSPTATGTRMETREEVIERVNAWFARDPETYNFGFFNNVIRPELSSIATGLYGKNEVVAGKAVRDIIRTIDGDMVDFVAKSDPNLAEAAVEAKRYYQEEFAPFWRDGKLEEFATLREATTLKPTSYQAGATTLVEGTIAEGNAANIGQFKRLLERPEAGANSGALADYMVYDAIGNMASSIRSAGNLTEVPIDQLTSNLKQYSDALNTVFPEKAAELTNFVRRVEAAQGDLTALKTIMEEAQTSVTQVKEAVQASELTAFFRGIPDSKVTDPLMRDMSTTNNPFAAFESIFKNQKDGFDIVDGLMARIKTAPPEQRAVLEAGMQTAYTKYVRNALINRKEELGGLRAVNPANIDKALDETSNLFTIGDVIFRDKPEVMETLRGLTELASGSAKSRNAAPISAMSPTAFNQSVSTATNRIIYATMGPLTRGGTRLRALINAAVEKADPTRVAAQVMDSVLADPNKFVEVARRIQRQPNDEVAQTIMLRIFTDALVRPTTDEGTSASAEVAPFLAEAEVQARDTMDDQMNGAFSRPVVDEETLRRYGLTP